MIDSHIKFCKHMNLSETPRILQMAGSCETLEETVMLLDDYVWQAQYHIRELAQVLC